MRKNIFFLFLTALSCGIQITVSGAQTATQPEQRQLGPHQHGHGQFSMVIEGKKAVMELHIPGHDITGFEHKPSTPAQVAVINQSQAKLKSGLSLFVPSAAAKCKLISSKVETASDNHEDEGDAPDDGSHMEFNVHYEVECDAPEKLDQIRFNFFKVFPSTQVLEVMIISDIGQQVYNLTSASPVADLRAQ